MIKYFPGFGGDENSKMFAAIREQYPDSDLVLYDNINAEIAMRQIATQLEDVTDSDNLLIIGQSLGGFWAHKFAVKLGCPMILVNPSFQPHKSLGKYNLSEAQLNEFESLEEQNTSENAVTIILSQDDEVVDPKPVIDQYTGKAKFIAIDGGHQVTNYDALLDAIKERQ